MQRPCTVSCRFQLRGKTFRAGRGSFWSTISVSRLFRSSYAVAVVNGTAFGRYCIEAGTA